MEENIKQVEEQIEQVTENVIEKALAKIKEQAKSQMEKAIFKFFENRVPNSEALAQDIMQEHKTMKKCCDYVTECARKEIKGNSGFVEDDKVYEWAEDYFHLDDKALEEKKAKKEKERRQREKEAAEKRKEAAKKAEEKKKQEAKAEPKSESKPKEPKKKNNEFDGQMDLFSFMNDMGGA